MSAVNETKTKTACLHSHQCYISSQKSLHHYSYLHLWHVNHACSTCSCWEPKRLSMMGTSIY